MIKHFEENLVNLLKGPEKVPNTTCVESGSSRKENEFNELSPEESGDNKFFSKKKGKPPKQAKVKGNSKWKTNPGLPPGWKWKTYKTDPDRERRMLLSPEQKRYLSIYSALRQMQRVEGKEEEVAILSRLLAKEGWFSTELLPTGYWLKQKRSERSFLSLTPAFQQLRTMRELFDHLRCEGHSEEMVARVQNNYR